MSRKTLDEIQELKVLISQLKEFCETIRDILHDKDILEIGRDSCFDNMVLSNKLNTASSVTLKQVFYSA